MYRALNFGVGHIRILLFLAIMLLWLNNASSQATSNFDYQLILENKTDVNILYNNSKINPENYMEIKDIESMSQLYPILKFEDSLNNNINSILQLEANFRSNNLNFENVKLSFLELYGQLSTKSRHYFTFGKKRLNWGTGLIWNPTIFYTQKDPLRTQNRLEGVFLLSYAYIFERGSLELYIFPEDSLDESKASFKYNLTANRLDASLSYLILGKDNHQVGYDISYGGNYFTLYSEGVLRNFSKSYGIDRDGSLKSHRMGKKVIPEVVVGFSIILHSNVTLFSEYRYRRDHLNKNEVSLFEKYLPSNSILFDPISVSELSLFNSLEYRDTYGRWSLSIRNFYDPISNQFLISPLFFYTNNNFQVELSTMLYNNSLAIFRSQSTLLLSMTF